MGRMKQKDKKSKRKSDEVIVSNSSSKKSRLDDPPVTPSNDPSTHASKDIPTVFIVDRLAGPDGLATAREIANCAEAGENDLVLEFLSGGGRAKDLLAPLVSEEKVKAVDVAAVFNAVETVVLRVVKGLDQFRPVATDLQQQVLADHSKEVVLLLSGTNTAYQAKSVLRMLTAFVTLGPSAARELLVRLNMEHKNWETLPKRR